MIMSLLLILRLTTMRNYSAMAMMMMMKEDTLLEFGSRFVVNNIAFVVNMHIRLPFHTRNHFGLDCYFCCHSQCCFVHQIYLEQKINHHL